ncbi:MAG TPA: peptidylprolyl isomerase [Acetobacteraceae bacterium]|nr:peptidylprolyl isomerase [Acetobacteraceae bacterium]
MAACLLAPAAALAQYPGGGGIGGPGGGYGGYGTPGSLGTAAPQPEEKPEHTVVPKGEEPAIPIPPPVLKPAPPDADAIAATVNGDVVTRDDVENRTKLFALSTGLNLTPELLSRLRPQITRELIDDRLRQQEIQRRKIVVADADVAAAIAVVEQRNGLQPGGLRAKLQSQGVSYSTLISQVRTSLGWTRVLRQELAERGFVTPAEVDAQEKRFKAQIGQPQYHVAEIFVPAEDPSRQNDARKFADTVIQQLRAGAPFGIVAAEFSQSETALKGGDLGWVRPDQLDPQLASLVTQMPVGAVSNPVHIAGGFDVVTLEDKRLSGSDMATIIDARQAFYPFTTALDPQAPTPQQRAALSAAQALSKSATTCDQVAAANTAQGAHRPSDPGPIRVDHLNPQMQTLMNALEPGKASKALVTPDGVLVVMVCKREQRNMAAMTREDIADQMVQERVELASRQLLQDLKRRALIDQRES